MILYDYDAEALSRSVRPRQSYSDGQVESERTVQKLKEVLYESISVRPDLSVST
ncbi:hypothetical protein YC2023_033754 [Brassica napus]